LNPLSIGEASWVIGMLLAFATGALLGYCWKLREHDRQIASILKIAHRIEAAKAAKKERTPQAEPSPCPSGNGLPC
jgi:hypothetical protein